MSDCKPECDCMVCRNRRHREAVWARHNAGKDYIGLNKALREREPLDPNWSWRPEPQSPVGVIRASRGGR